MENIQQDVGGNKARWIRACVETFEHPLLDKGPYDRRSAWLWLIANAAWKTKRVNHKGKVITLERGQVLIGRAFLAETWGWSEQMVRTFAQQLCSEGMLEINQSNGHFANIATICNYEKYQTAQSENGQSNNQSATSAQPVSNQTFTKDTNTTNYNNPSRVVLTAAREEVAVAQPRLSDRLIEAAGGCLDNAVNCQGLLNEAIPMMWIESGCDLERDILPTLRAAAIKHRGRRLRTWDYFTGMVGDARDKRLAGIPTSNVKYIDRANMVYQPSRYGPGKWVPKSAGAPA